MANIRKDRYKIVHDILLLMDFVAATLNVLYLRVGCAKFFQAFYYPSTNPIICGQFT